jgi:hypothetical protein
MIISFIPFIYILSHSRVRGGGVKIVNGRLDVADLDESSLVRLLLANLTWEVVHGCTCKREQEQT